MGYSRQPGKDEEGAARQRCGRGEFQTEGTAGAKSLRQGRGIWHVMSGRKADVAGQRKQGESG